MNHSRFLYGVVFAAFWLLTPLVYPESARANSEDTDLTALFNEVPPEPSLADQEESVDSLESLEPDPDRLIVDKKKKKFAGWGPYDRSLRAICAGLVRDGRALELKQLVEKKIGTSKRCNACDPLYKSLVKSCQPRKSKESLATKKKRAKKEAEEMADSEGTPTPVPTPVAIVLQREPSLEIQIALQGMREQLDLDLKRKEEGYQALTNLAQLLKSLKSEQNPAGRRDYFLHLSAWIIDEEQATQKDKHKNSDSDHNGTDVHVGGASDQDINDLFD